MALDAERTADGKLLLRDRGATIAWTRPDMFDVDHRLRDMDAKGIDMRVLSVSAPNVYPFSGATSRCGSPATSTTRWRAIAAPIPTASSGSPACRCSTSRTR